MLVDFTLDEQERCVQGHFPGAPLVPGAWLLAKIDLCLREHLPHHRLTGFSKVKFVAPLYPGIAAQLQADIAIPEGSTALPTARITLRILADGQLILEARALLE